MYATKKRVQMPKRKWFILSYNLYARDMQTTSRRLLDYLPRGLMNHQIPLLRGAEPANLRPYRHPWELKNTIEKMIEEMLEA